MSNAILTMSFLVLCVLVGFATGGVRDKTKEFGWKDWKFYVCTLAPSACYLIGRSYT